MIWLHAFGAHPRQTTTTTTVRLGESGTCVSLRGREKGCWIRASVFYMWDILAYLFMFDCALPMQAYKEEAIGKKLE
ncbi:hypothetical protein BC936DRAFT_141453 [Jimgerdemannia flammicorona]|uniref:Uncharacterized protein n=1 Tax=Jimgerdemannia flammicorona TaxID=994334 RepID=A0A433DG45_9FUNG|nr:hypothetical protein BC936DRAFT_141453 [Jimgerdemannia flammicorona]